MSLNRPAPDSSAPLVAPASRHQLHIRSVLMDNAPASWTPSPNAMGSPAITPTGTAPLGEQFQPERLGATAAQSPAKSPAIEITIGRIDVRVTPPSPPAKKTRRSPAQGPALSLRDYLDHRNRP